MVRGRYVRGVRRVLCALRRLARRTVNGTSWVVSIVLNAFAVAASEWALTTVCDFLATGVLGQVYTWFGNLALPSALFDAALEGGGTYV